MAFTHKRVEKVTAVVFNSISPAASAAQETIEDQDGNTVRKWMVGKKYVVNDGDYIVTNSDGQTFVMDATRFADQYEALP